MPKVPRYSNELYSIIGYVAYRHGVSTSPSLKPRVSQLDVAARYERPFVYPYTRVDGLQKITKNICQNSLAPEEFPTLELVNMELEGYLLDVKDGLIESNVHNALRIGQDAATNFSWQCISHCVKYDILPKCTEGSFSRYEVQNFLEECVQRSVSKYV